MAAEKNLTSPIGSPLRDKELDQFLPIANVSRIMKKSLPTNAKISKEVKETVQTCVSEFISFITGEASDKCQREKRKTINGDDLLETEGDHLKNPNMSRQEEQPLSGINDTIINHEVIGYGENWVNGGFTMGNFPQLG
ncbi:nuclear transcription factor Y subunit B-3-like [Rhododendron vialii]|uniref:nuclear transcription factor Y subunit B-3-like n=1 Tax=Rhododendron vialii TaxID=182163 RepID=UPI00265E2E31|nr:nuclear transcription factor Y subunit B-3-like [Rhododendron vialii]